MKHSGDPHGKAICDYLYSGKAEKLWVHNIYAGREEMPVEVFFREEYAPLYEIKP